MHTLSTFAERDGKNFFTSTFFRTFFFSNFHIKTEGTAPD